MELSQPILNKFLNELIKYNDFYSFHDRDLITIIEILADKSKWHIELPNNVWKLSAWKSTEQKRKKELAEREAYNAKVDIRKEIYSRLRISIEKKLGAGEDIARSLASKIMNMGGIEQAKFFGVDISDMPKLDKKHEVLEGRKVYEV